MNIKRIQLTGAILTAALLSGCQTASTPTPIATSPAKPQKPAPNQQRPAELLEISFQNLNSEATATVQSLNVATVTGQGISNGSNNLSQKVLSVQTFTDETTGRRHVATTIEFTYNGDQEIMAPVLVPVNVSSTDTALGTIDGTPFSSIKYYDGSPANEKATSMTIGRAKFFNTGTLKVETNLDSTPYAVGLDLSGLTFALPPGYISANPYADSGWKPSVEVLKKGDVFTATFGLDIAMDKQKGSKGDPYAASMMLTMAQGAPKVQEPTGVDRSISITGDLSGNTLETRQPGIGVLNFKNETNAPLNITIRQPENTGDGYLFVGDMIDYNTVLPAGVSTEIAYYAKCQDKAGLVEKNVEVTIKETNQVKTQKISFECLDVPPVAGDPQVVLASDNVLTLPAALYPDVLSYDKTAGRLLMQGASDFAKSLKVGSIITSGPIDGVAPEGMLLEATAVNTVGSAVEVLFKEADLSKVFTEADIKNVTDPTAANIDFAASKTAEGVTMQAGAGDNLVEYSFDELLLGDRKDKNNYLTAKGTLTIAKPKLTYELGVSALGLQASTNGQYTLQGLALSDDGQLKSMFLGKIAKKFTSAAKSVGNSIKSLSTNIANTVAKAATGVYNSISSVFSNITPSIKIKAYAQVSETANVKLEGKVNQKFLKKTLLGTINFKPIVAQAGPVPIVVIHKMEVFLNLEGGFKGQARYELKHSLSYKLGIDYNSSRSQSFVPINELTNNFTQNYALNAEAYAKAKLVGRYTADLYGKYGIFAEGEFGPEAYFTVNGSAGTWRTQICQKANVGINPFELDLIVKSFKVNGASKEVYSGCLYSNSGTFSVPLQTKIQYSSAGTFIENTSDEEPLAVDYGSALFRNVIEGKDAGATYLYDWSLGSAAPTAGTADGTKAFTFPASMVGRQMTVNSSARLASGVFDRKADQSLKIIVRNSAPTVALEAPKWSAKENLVRAYATVADVNETLTCDRVGWYSSAVQYTVNVSKVPEAGKCFADFKFAADGTYTVSAYISDELGVKTNQNASIVIAPAPPAHDVNIAFDALIAATTPSARVSMGTSTTVGNLTFTSPQIYALKGWEQFSPPGIVVLELNRTPSYIRSALGADKLFNVTAIKLAGSGTYEAYDAQQKLIGSFTYSANSGTFSNYVEKIVSWKGVSYIKVTGTESFLYSIK